MLEEFGAGNFGPLGAQAGQAGVRVTSPYRGALRARNGHSQGNTGGSGLVTTTAGRPSTRRPGKG